MDFSWQPEQSAAKAETVEFAQRELNSDVVADDQSGAFSLEKWKACADFGIQGVVLPRALGGLARDPMTAALTMEGLGYGCRDNGLVFGLNAQIWTVQQSIAEFGSVEQKQRYLPELASGRSIAAHAITEPSTGSDAYSLETRAVKCNNEYTLNGEKALITLAPVADFALVFASTNPEAGNWGISAFLVATDAAGLTIGAAQHKMGLRTVPLSTISFEDCRVAESTRLGAEGAGMSIFNASLEWERSCMLASHIGAMQRQLDEAVAYARQRKQFGKPIGKFQSVANRIADMKLRLETARLLVYKVAWLKSQGKPVAMEAALAKLHVSECYTQSALAAILVQGGRGYLSENEVERELRDAVGSLLWGGTTDIQRNVVARLIGL